MKICDVLATYKRSDLNRLAKDKIANYVGLPVDILQFNCKTFRDG